MCKVAINLLNPMYFGTNTNIREQARCIINDYGVEALFEEICEHKGIPIEPCNFDLINVFRNRSTYESDYDEDGNTIIEEDYDNVLQFPYQERGEFYRSYLKTLVVGEEDVDRSVWSCVPAPMA